MSGRRGQLLLIAGLGIAMTLVVLAIVLNTVIFTQNLATREAVDARSPVEFVNAADEGIGGAITRVNFWNASGYAAMDATFKRALTTWAGNTSRLRAGRGIVTTTTLHSTTNGTRIVQSSNGTWTSASDAQGWTMAADVSEVRRFNANVSRDGLAEDDGANLPTSNAFRINVTDGTDTWSLYVYRLSSDTDVVEATAIAPDGSSTTCSTPAAFVELDVTRGAPVDSDCGFTFGENVSRPFDMNVDDGENIGAKYTLVVDQSTTAFYAGVPDQTYHQQATGESPFTAPAIYNASLNVTAERSDIRYTKNFSVAPEDPPGGESFQIAPSASARELVYVNASSGQISSIDKWGTVTTYDASSPAVVGPKHTNLTGDEALEIPYVTTSGDINLIDADDVGPSRSVSASAATTDTSIAVGTWNGATSIFYVNTSDASTIYRWTPDTGIHAQVPGALAANAVVGITDYNGDGDTDIVYIDSSTGELVYYDDSTTSTGVTPAVDESIGVGAPRDLDRSGDRRAPYVTGTDIAIVDSSGSSTILVADDAVETNIAAFDVTGDDQLEVVYVNSTTGELSYVTLDNTTGPITTAGSGIAVDESVGVA